MEHKEKTKIVKVFFGIIILFLIIYLFLRYGHNLKHINVRMIKSFILSYGKWSIIVFILIYTFKPIFIVFPTWVLAVVAGNVYGTFYGTVLNVFCCFTSASVAFFLSKMFGKPFVEKILKGKTLKLDEGIEKHGFFIMLLMRLSFVFPYDPLSYAAGLTKMKYKDFILGTVLGISLEMFVYVLLGKNLEKPISIKFFIPIMLLVCVAGTSYYVYNKFKKNKE